MLNENTELNSYHKNPRKVTAKMDGLLKGSLEEYGDLGGIVFNVRNKQLVGGHQRTRVLKDSSDLHISEELATPTENGTVGWGYLEKNGERFTVRFVDWEEEKHAKANLLANKVTGGWDFDILANEFEMEQLLEVGFEPTELGIVNDFHKNDVDVDNFNNQLDTYLEGAIKQIVMYFNQKEYDDLIPKLEVIMEKEGIANHSELFLFMLKQYEDTRTNS